MDLEGWDWSVAGNALQHNDRFALLRAVPYQITERVDVINQDLKDRPEELIVLPKGLALSVNISSGGMLLLMSGAPEVGRVLKVDVPTPIHHAKAPTLTEVRWTRKIPFHHDSLHFVGIKFLF